MSRLRKFILIDLFLEVTFWLGALTGIIFGLLFAQRKGEKFREEMNKKWQRSGFKAVREITTDEIKAAGKETWETIKRATLQSKAGKQARKTTNEIWIDIDPETKKKIKRGVSRVKTEVGKVAERIRPEVKKATSQAKKEVRKAIRDVKKTATKTIKNVQKTTRKK